MLIDIFSDTVCPWCFIGKRHLERALTKTGITDADINWHAFQLNPDMPAAGRDRKTYLAEKFGPDAERHIHTRLQDAGRAAGIEFQFEKIVRSPNTLDSHRLIRLAGARGKQNAVVEALFQAYFIEGRDIGDRQVLLDIAATLGLGDDVDTWLDSEAEVDTVRDEDRSARQLGSAACHSSFSSAAMHYPALNLWTYSSRLCILPGMKFQLPDTSSILSESAACCG